MKEMKTNVLIIDDDKDFSRSLSDSLEESGFSVKTANNPKKGIEEFRKKIFHVVLLDLRMPGMSGEELLAELRRIDDDASVIVITAYPSIDSAVSTTKLDSYAYLTKPFEVERLIELIREAIEQRGIKTPPERQILSTLGEEIRRVRKDRVLTQGQLANRTDLSRSLISRIESGSAAPSIPSLYKIANALNVRMGTLFANIPQQIRERDRKPALQ
jgi:DNA-binding NtrC family response regulator